MKRLMSGVRMRLAFSGFLAIYTPVLIMLLVVNASTIDETVLSAETMLADGTVLADEIEIDQVTAVDGSGSAFGSESRSVVIETSGLDWLPLIITVILLAPLAAALAWWWSGRAVRPIEQAVTIQEHLIEEASHELRTPLAVLSNNAEVLLDHPEPTIALYRSGFERTKAASDRMSATIDGLLVDARGRARTVTRQAADLAAIAVRATDAVAATADARGVTVRCEPATEVRARVDPLSIERAITNLVRNAIEAAPSGSVVTVDAIKGDAKDRAQVVVTDQGPGIPPAEQAKIFERYWQGEQAGEAGIGLSIVRQVANAHGGEVTVESPVHNGIGSRFCLTVAC